MRRLVLMASFGLTLFCEMTSTAMAVPDFRLYNPFTLSSDAEIANVEFSALALYQVPTGFSISIYSSYGAPALFSQSYGPGEFALTLGSFTLNNTTYPSANISAPFAAELSAGSYLISIFGESNSLALNYYLDPNSAPAAFSYAFDDKIRELSTPDYTLQVAFRFLDQSGAKIGGNDWNANQLYPGLCSPCNPNLEILDPIPVVPEPSTWAMLLIGFAGLGFATYRRSRPADAHQTKPVAA